jgi:phosphatidylserine decarboxylase
MSRAWGEINSIDLPIWCRKPCFYLYSWVFNCNLNEIDIEDLNEFKNLSEFFRRGLKPDVRVIDQQSCLVYFNCLILIC